MSWRMEHATFTIAILLYLLSLASSVASFSVCVLDSPGFVACDPTKPSSSYTGFDVELFRNVAQYVGYVENSNLPVNSSSVANQYKFVCIREPSYSAVMELLVDNSSTASCSIALGMITITTERLDLGVRFSHSYFHSGLKIMIYTQPVPLDAWSFFKPFSWDTWLALGLTVLFVPMLIWLIERANTDHKLVFNRASVEDLRLATYKTLLSVARLDVQPVVSWASQLVVLALSFLLLVMLCTYTANLASLYTTSSIDVAPSNLDSLRGKPVATSSVYQAVLKQNYGLTTSVVDWSGESTFLAVRQALENGTLQAYIMGEVALSINMAAYNEGCRLRLVGSMFQPFSYGFAFSSVVSSETIDLIDLGLVWAQESHRLSALTDQFLSPRQDTCYYGMDAHVHFSQVAGLWYILAGVVVVALVWSLVSASLHPHSGPDSSPTGSERRPGACITSATNIMHPNLSCPSTVDENSARIRTTLNEFSRGMLRTQACEPGTSLRKASHEEAKAGNCTATTSQQVPAV